MEVSAKIWAYKWPTTARKMVQIHNLWTREFTTYTQLQRSLVTAWFQFSLLHRALYLLGFVSCLHFNVFLLVNWSYISEGIGLFFSVRLLCSYFLRYDFQRFWRVLFHVWSPLDFTMSFPCFLPFSKTPLSLRFHQAYLLLPYFPCGCCNLIADKARLSGL